MAEPTHGAEPQRLDDMLLFQFDGQLVQVRQEMNRELPEAHHELVAALCRASYGKGLCDAMKDPEAVAALLAAYGYDRYGCRA